MRVIRRILVYVLLVTISGSAFGAFAQVSADRFSSTDYTVDASLNSSFGDNVGSTSYGLYDAGGEPVIGRGASGSYTLDAGYISALNKSIKLAVQPAGLMAYFPLDEISGTQANDSSATSAPAYFTGTPTWLGSGQVAGSIATSSGNYLKTTATSVYDTTTLTACAWAKMTTATTSNPYFLTRTAGTVADNNWGLGTNLTTVKAKALIVLSGTSYTVVSSLADPGIGTWYHSCMTYDGSVLRLYVNGQAAGTNTINLPLGSNTQPISIGARTNGSQFFTGSLDEVQVYNRVLSADEITALYTGGAAGLQSGIGLGTITSGTSNIANFDTIVETDSDSYDLAISTNHQLQNGATTIPAVSGIIAFPAAWSEGTTKGLGFTLSAAAGLDPKWGSGTNYAAFPLSDITFYSRAGFSGGGTKDVINMQARVDVSASQIAGLYSAQFTVTGTTKP